MSPARKSTSKSAGKSTRAVNTRGIDDIPGVKPVTGREMVPADQMIEEEQTVNMSRGGLSVYNQTPALDSSDVLIPKLRLAQGLTPEVQSGDAKPGQWLLTGEEPFQDIVVIPVGLARRRELRDPDSRSSILCRSGDGISGVGDPGGNCATCEMAAWTPTKSKKAGAKNSPPLCAFIYSYMVYVPETKSVALLEFSRTALTVGKMLNTMVAQKGLGAFGVRLGASSRQSTQGTFYSPTVSMESAKPEVLKAAQQRAAAMM